MSRTVQVKQCDIVRGECSDTRKCALARALNRTFKQKGWAIHGAHVICSPYGKIYRVTNKHAEKVNRFIHRFDDQETVKPIKFSIIPVQ